MGVLAYSDLDLKDPSAVFVSLVFPSQISVSIERKSVDNNLCQTSSQTSRTAICNDMFGFPLISFIDALRFVAFPYFYWQARADRFVYVSSYQCASSVLLPAVVLRANRRRAQ